LRGVEAKLSKIKGSTTKAEVLSSCRTPYARVPHPPTGFAGCGPAGNASDVEISDGDDGEYNPRAESKRYCMRSKPRK